MARNSNEQFLEKAKNKGILEKYTVLSEYKGFDEYITYKCNDCGCMKQKKAKYFVKEFVGCKKCQATKQSKSDDQFKEELLLLYGNDYICLSEYENNKKRVKIKHKCGFVFEAMPHDATRKRMVCPVCFSATRTTHEAFLVKAKEGLKRYDILSKYKNKRTKVLIRCKKCGNERYIQPIDLIKGVGCTYCGKLKRGRDNKLFEKEFNEKNNNYKLMSEFKGIFEEITVKCLICGKISNVIASNSIYRKLNCASCSQMKTIEEVKNDIFELVGEEYELISGYNGDKNNVDLKHNKCGYIWNVRLTSFTRGTRCPKCTTSKGEDTVIKFLDENKIKYNIQQKFKDLKGTGDGYLSYDFAILGKRNGIKMLIEYDGSFHYVKSSLNNNLEKQLIHDNIKSEYAKKKRIPLLRIPYWEFDNIENILNEKLGEFTNENK